MGSYLHSTQSNSNSHPRHPSLPPTCLKTSSLLPGSSLHISKLPVQVWSTRVILLIDHHMISTAATFLSNGASSVSQRQTLGGPSQPQGSTKSASLAPSGRPGSTANKGHRSNASASRPGSEAAAAPFTALTSI